jgi:predicted GIY-YIG superfamily endonuclease
VIVYRVTNTQNGRIYIGATTQSLSRRRSEHKSRAKRQGSNSEFHDDLRALGEAAFFYACKRMEAGT